MNGSVEMGASAARRPLLPKHLDKKSVDFSDNRAKCALVVFTRGHS